MDLEKQFLVATALLSSSLTPLHPLSQKEGNIKDLVTEIHKFEVVLICPILKGAKYIYVFVCVCV